VNFLLCGAQHEFQTAVHRYLEKALPAKRLHELFDSEGVHDANLWRGLAEIGVTGLLAGTAYDGLGLLMIDAAIVAETLGHAATPLPYLGH
jgi:alkylation response protein AidB-like acyl-CoA dehydrogenase